MQCRMLERKTLTADEVKDVAQFVHASAHRNGNDATSPKTNRPSDPIRGPRHRDSLVSAAQ